jgi:predicted ATPase
LEKELVVITGGPGTGKTTIINKLLEKGFYCFPEISREITLRARENGIEQLFLENPILFSEQLLKGRIKQFEEAKNHHANIVFLDRGIPDVLAYMHYIGDSYTPNFKQACSEKRYTKILLLPPWEAIYTSDEERYENFEQAKLIYKHLKETYQFFDYSILEVPIGTVDDRVEFIISTL